MYTHVLVNCGTCFIVYMYVFPSLKQLEDFKTWQAHDDAEENFCELDGKVQVILFFSISPIPPFTPTHPCFHGDVLVWSVCLSCLSCLSSSGLSPGAKLCGPGTQPRALYWLCWTLPTQNMGSHLPRELLQVNNPQYILCMLKCLQG